MNNVTIYTDGSCLGNPGFGGYAAILTCAGKKKTVVGSEANTTNNRMELQAIVSALKALTSPCSVSIHSDSAYVVNSFARLPIWKSAGWRNANGAVKNKELWQELDELISRRGLVVTFGKVEAHSGVELNERCDQLAKAEAEKLKASCEARRRPVAIKSDGASRSFLVCRESL